MPGPDEADRDRLIREIETRVRGAQRTRRVRCVDHHRDVALRRPLRDRSQIDACLTDRAEEARRDAGTSGHPVADHRENAAPGRDVDPLNLTVMPLGKKGALHRIARPLGCFLGDGKADRMLRAALRDHHDGDAFVAKRTEEPVRGARHADHAGALEIQQRNRLDGGQALHRLGRRRERVDPRSRVRGSERVSNVDRQRALHRRRHRARVNHLGTEVRELHRFVVRQIVERHRFRDEPWVGAHHAIHVGPDMNFLSVQQCGKDRRAEVAAVSAKRGRDAVRGRRDEAGDDHRRRQ